MKPNYRLKHEREQRGWSQAKLAEMVGTNPATVGRWERGISLPYPIHREKLCKLFNKEMQELGLIEEENTLRQMSPVLPINNPFIFDPAIPMLPIETSSLVGRDVLLTRLKQQIYATEEVAPLSALCGLPGAGKTTLALALAHDQDVQKHFSGGILWVGLGIKPDVQELQSRWGTLLGLSLTEMAGIKSCDDWSRTLRALIGMRRMLLIIDDVWNIDDALAFQIGGPHCAYIITTRFPQIAIQIAGSQTAAVPELSENDGVKLLAHFVPELIKYDDLKARQLVHSVGALPLALVLMGRYLRTHAYNEQPRRLRAAIVYLSNAEKRLHLSEPYSLAKPGAGYSSETLCSLESVIALSDKQLDIKEQSMLRALAVFPPKPNTFSEDAAIAISGLSAENLDTLCDAGLLESSGPGRYMLHQTIFDYAREQMGEHRTILYQRMIAYMLQYVEIHETDYQALEQENSNILAALEEALKRKMQQEFVQGVNLFAPFLRIRGLYDEATRYLLQAYQVAQDLHDNFATMQILSHLGQITKLQSEFQQGEGYLRAGLLLARQLEQPEYIYLFLIHLGEAREKLGDYTEAETYVQEGLTLARQLDQPEYTCQVLIVLGHTAMRQGNYEQAQHALSEGLHLARQLGDKEVVSQMLTELGLIAASKEDFPLARTYYEEALALARQIDYRDAIIRLLINLGAVAGSSGDYEQAERYLREGLQQAHQLGNRMRMALLLNNLGALTAERGRYTEAQAYLQDGLNLARQINHPWLIYTNFCERGEAALIHRRYNEAHTAFNEVLTHAPELSQEIRAIAHYGMARVMASQGRIDEACYHGETSRTIFEALGLPKAATIRNWLETLCGIHSETHRSTFI